MTPTSIYLFFIKISTVYRHKIKRGDNPLKAYERKFEIIMISQNHTDHKSREGISSSSATSLLISLTDISPDSCKIRIQLRTKLREDDYTQPLPPHPILLYEQFQRLTTKVQERANQPLENLREG